MGYTWEEICNDPILAELPFKIESDQWGNVIMSPPAGAAHSDFQGEITVRLARLMRGGHAQPEYPLQTSKGVKAIDVVWVSSKRRKQKPKDSIVYLLAPEICVEVLSPRNTRTEIDEKILLYFERGAHECWICDKIGGLRFFDAAGPMIRSRLCPKFPPKLARD